MQIVTATRINIRNDGQVLDVLPMLIKSTCKIDVTWFPFDDQKCSLIFGSWSLSSKELRLEFSEKGTYYTELVTYCVLTLLTLLLRSDY